MTYVGILLLGVSLGAIEIPPLIRKGQRREAVAVVGILLLGTAYALAQAMKLPIPTVSQVLQWLVGSLVPV